MKWEREMAYKFYGWEGADVAPINAKYKNIKNPRELYDMLSKIWCADTCAPRMREDWSEDNKTLGQCSITAFLAQDIFGGKVYGVPRSGGNFHCYNVVDDVVFDLTSEQFGDEKLIYEDNPEQLREVHFAKEEKKLRYEYLKAELDKFTEFVTFNITSRDGKEIEMAVVDEFEYNGKNYLVSAVVENDCIKGEARYIYRMAETKDGFRAEKILDPKYYEEIAAAYMEME